MPSVCSATISLSPTLGQLSLDFRREGVNFSEQLKCHEPEFFPI